MEDNRTQLLYTIIGYYGKDAQVMQSIEEMSELIKELLKNINRKLNNKDKILEELADVELTLEQLKLIYQLSQEDINAIKEDKISTVLMRIIHG